MGRGVSRGGIQSEVGEVCVVTLARRQAVQDAHLHEANCRLQSSGDLRSQNASLYWFCSVSCIIFLSWSFLPYKQKKEDSQCNDPYRTTQYMLL